MSKYSIFEYDIDFVFESMEDENIPIDIDNFEGNFENESDVLEYIERTFDMDELANFSKNKLNHVLEFKIEIESERCINAYIVGKDVDVLLITILKD